MAEENVDGTSKGAPIRDLFNNIPDEHKNNPNAVLVAGLIELGNILKKNEESNEQQRSKLDQSHKGLENRQTKLIERQTTITFVGVLAVGLFLVVSGFYVNYVVKEVRNLFESRRDYHDRTERVARTITLFKDMQEWDLKAREADAIYLRYRKLNFLRSDTVNVKQKRSSLLQNNNVNTLLNYFEIWKMYDQAEQLDSATAANMLPYFESVYNPVTDNYIALERERYHNFHIGAKEPCNCGLVFDGYDIIFHKYLGKPIKETKQFDGRNPKL